MSSALMLVVTEKVASSEQKVSYEVLKALAGPCKVEIVVVALRASN